jgi:hypothetical protein
MSGFICIDRGLFDHPLVGAHNPKYFIAWHWMLKEARWKPHRKEIAGTIVEIGRGEIAHSLNFMAQGTKLSVQQLRTFISKLESQKMVSKINTPNNNGLTRLSICNYDVYQDAENYINKRSNKRVTSDQQATNKRATTTRKKEEIKDEIPEAIKVSQDADCDIQKAFDAYNELADLYNLPKAQILTLPRRSKLKQRLKDCDGLAGWLAALDKVSQSDFLLGNKTDFNANLDFLLQASSFTKLVEGNYDNHAKPTTRAHTRAQREAGVFEKFRNMANNNKPHLKLIEGNGNG